MKFFDALQFFEKVLVATVALLLASAFVMRGWGPLLSALTAGMLFVAGRFFFWLRDVKPGWMERWNLVSFTVLVLFGFVLSVLLAAVFGGYDFSRLDRAAFQDIMTGREACQAGGGLYSVQGECRNATVDRRLSAVYAGGMVCFSVWDSNRSLSDAWPWFPIPNNSLDASRQSKLT